MYVHVYMYVYVYYSIRTRSREFNQVRYAKHVDESVHDEDREVIIDLFPAVVVVVVRYLVSTSET